MKGVHTAQQPATAPASVPAEVSMAHAVAGAAVALGRTYLLEKGGTDRSTEGVAAPVCLLDMGVTSMLDLAEFFDTEQEVRSACAHAGQGAEEMAVAAWQQSKLRAPALALLLGQRASQPQPPQPPSSCTSTSSRPFFLDPSGLSTRSGAVSAHRPPVPIPQPTPYATVTSAPDRSTLRERDEQVVMAKRGLIDTLLGVYYGMGPRGKMWEEVPQEEIEAQRSLLAARPARLTAPHLRQIVLAWERWTKAKPATADVYQPSPTHLGLFLQKEAEKGPTVAPSRMRGFRWMSSNLGLPFPVEAAVVRDFVQAPPDHTPKQAQSLAPEDFINVLCLALRGGSNGIPAKLVILACTSCIRCKHFARSALQQTSGHAWISYCSKGKSVRKGARPPYAWGVPILPQMGSDFFDFLHAILKRWDTPPFLVPAFKAGTTRRKFNARRWLQQPMSNRQWVACLRQVAVAIGWAPEDTQALSYNSMRRFLPTLGDVLRFSADDSQALGSWQELPQASGCAGKASQRMSLHYSDERALSSCEVKRRALTQLLQIAERHPQASACLMGILPFLPKGAFTWEDIAQNPPLPAGPSSSTSAPLVAPMLGDALVPCRRQLSIEDEESTRGRISKGRKDRKDKKDKRDKKDKKDKNGKKAKQGQL